MGMGRLCFWSVVGEPGLDMPVPLCFYQQTVSAENGSFWRQTSPFSQPTPSLSPTCCTTFFKAAAHLLFCLFLHTHCLQLHTHARCFCAGFSPPAAPAYSSCTSPTLFFSLPCPLPPTTFSTLTHATFFCLCHYVYILPSCYSLSIFSPSFLL